MLTLNDFYAEQQQRAWAIMKASQIFYSIWRRMDIDAGKPKINSGGYFQIITNRAGGDCRDIGDFNTLPVEIIEVIAKNLHTHYLGWHHFTKMPVEISIPFRYWFSTNTRSITLPLNRINFALRPSQYGRHPPR